MTPRQRLKYLADYLEKFPPIQNKFDMENWAQNTERTQAYCGFSACAIGHAGGLAKFAAEGFFIAYRNLETSSGLTPIFGDYLNWDAVENFFGLSSDIAHWIFAKTAYSQRIQENLTPAHVVERIRKYLDDTQRKT